MKTGSINSTLITCSFLSLGATAVSQASASVLLPLDDKRPNVIFILTDQQRGDCIGAVNNNLVTPAIDSLARGGVLFTNGYSSSPSSTPARGVLLTGMSPWSAGMIGYHPRVGERYQYEMPRMMSEAGYQTIAVGKMHWYPQRNSHGFERMFLDESGRVESDGFVSDYRQWFAEVAPNSNVDTTGIGWNAHRGGVYLLPEELHPTRWSGDVAISEIMGRDKSRPLFLKLSFARPHSPYDPPQRLLDIYTQREIDAPFVSQWSDPYASRSMTDDAAFGDFGIAHALNSRRHYNAAITFVDEQIGRVIETLKSEGLYDNSIIIFTSDHGDMLGDHHHWRKTYPYQGSVHVPFVVKFPKGGVEGVVSDRCVELRDIMPTALDAAGVDIPSTVEGSSLFAFNSESQRDVQWREYIDLEHSACYEPLSGWVALTDGKSKYIWWYNRGEEMLFDLVSDPTESRCVKSVESYGATLDMWRSKMLHTLERRGEQWVKDGKLVKNSYTSPLSPNYPRS